MARLASKACIISAGDTAGDLAGEELFVARAYAHVLAAAARNKIIKEEATVSGHAAKRGIKECARRRWADLGGFADSIIAGMVKASGSREKSVRSRLSAAPNVVVAARRALCRRQRRLLLAKLYITAVCHAAPLFFSINHRISLF